MTGRNPAVFLDLNGTLVEPVKPRALAELELFPGAQQAVARLTSAGFLLPVVTVQSRIAKSYFSERDFRRWFDELRSVRLLGLGPVYVCPHRFNHDCECKKPKTLLYEQAAEDLGIDPTQSFVVGDTGTDVDAAESLGARSCLVLSGWGRMSRDEYERRADVVCDGVLDAAEWIIARKRRARRDKT
jgi:D-glycero-D-manno-heptose 1,7-bisphosphate phosphatase